MILDTPAILGGSPCYPKPLAPRGLDLDPSHPSLNRGDVDKLSIGL